MFKTIVVTQMLMIAVLVGFDVSAQAEDTIDVTVVLRGADTKNDVKVLLRSLRSAEGVKVLTKDVGLGFRKFNNRFTTPIVVRVPKTPGTDDANVGSLAIRVSKAKTANRSKFAPGVNLLLFTDGSLDESSISTLRSSLSQVNGVEVSQPGGLGGNIADGWCWIQFEHAGGAMLQEIEQQAQTYGRTYRRLEDEDTVSE